MMLRRLPAGSLLLRRSALGPRPLNSSSLSVRHSSSSTFAKTKRPLLSNYRVEPLKTDVQIEVAQPDDKDHIVDFLNKISVEREPTCVSTGTTAEDFRPFVDRVTEEGIKSGYTLVATHKGELVGASVGGRAVIDRSRKVTTAIRDNYHEPIERLKPWIPSLRARRVVGPAYDLVDIVNNFLPADVNEILRLDLSGVRSDFVGGNIVKKFLYEHCKMGLERGLKWTDGQTTAEGTRKAALAVGYKDVFAIPYEKMFDNGERIHPKVPLTDGATQLTLFLGRIEEIVEKTKC